MSSLIEEEPFTFTGPMYACWAAERIQKLDEQFRWQEYTVFESYSGMYIWKERETKKEAIVENP